MNSREMSSVLTATCWVTTLLGRTCFQVFLIEGERDVNRFSVTVHAMTLQSVQAGGEMLFFETCKRHKMFQYKITLSLKFVNVKKT